LLQLFMAGLHLNQMAVHKGRPGQQLGAVRRRLHQPLKSERGGGCG
jgi:hypothetical protein